MRSKSRSKSRTKSRSKPLSRRRQQSGSVGPSEADNDNIDADLSDFIMKIDGVETRATQLLQSLQNEISSCVNYMLDSIMAGITVAVDNVKNKVPQVQKIRMANRSIKTQLRALDELENA